MKRIVSLLCFLLVAAGVSAQTTDVLRKQIEQIIANKKADVGVSVIGVEDKDTLNINGTKHYPMISVFKFHVALTVLDKVDKGQLSLGKKIFIRKKELLEDTWSPFREKYPAGNVSITLKEALEWMIRVSDNNICDILIRLTGGVKAVETFIDSYPNFIIKNDEEGMHQNWDAQFINTTTPITTALLLREFYEGKILSKRSTAFLYRTMAATTVGANRIKGKLPPNTIVAHRTGSSFTNDEGVTGAINDIGIVQLPGGKHFIIAVYVCNTTEKFEAGEAIIADITKAAWDYFVGKKT